MSRNKNKLSRWQKIVIAICLLMICLGGGFYIYTLDYYHASDDVQAVLALGQARIETKEDMVVFLPEESKDLHAGLVFYPGGKVEAIAYAPLLRQLAEEGLTCILIEMPMNLAIFNSDAANDVYAMYPEMQNWFIAGHSLGGAMASSYMKNNSDKVNGLILLGAYPINDADVATLAIYGSEDVKLDLTKLETTEHKLEIAGGNHAYFGNYGEQEGDGQASISRAEQQRITVQAIMSFIRAQTE